MALAAVAEARVHPGTLPAAAVGAVDSPQSLAAGASVEATPRQLAAVGDLRALLRPGTEVYLPSPAGTDWTGTVAACRWLRRQGMKPVPHLAARALASSAELEARLADLVEAGVSAVLLIAGDARRAAGPFADTLGVLDTGSLARQGIKDLRVAVHPEGHPVAGRTELSRALAAKVAYARRTGTRLLLISQFAFSATAVLSWRRALVGADAPPLRVGLPGPSSMRRALAYAVRCGVGSSAKALLRRPELARLAGGWSPDAMLEDLAACADAASPLAGIHLFCFGGLPAAAQWLRERACGGASLRRLQ